MKISLSIKSINQNPFALALNQEDKSQFYCILPLKFISLNK